MALIMAVQLPVNVDIVAIQATRPKIAGKTTGTRTNDLRAGKTATSASETTTTATTTGAAFLISPRSR